MNLHDYFRSQRQVSLDPTDKVAIYETIMQKTHVPVSIFARMSFYTKVALYTFVGLVFLASLYVPYFSSFFQETDGILTSNGGTAIVQADYIAQIIETKGDVAIYNNGEKVESKLFRAGDRLVLPAGAEIVFHVTTIAQAKVIGPAEFFVEKNDQGYSIQLINGQYAEIQSLKPEDDKTEVTESIGFRSARVSIKSKQSNKMHFTYKEEGENAIINNQGDSELMVAKADDEADHEVLAMHTVAQLGSGEALFDTLTTGSVQAVSGVRLSPVQVANVLNQTPVADEAKKMISGEQHENIKAILSAEFLARDLQNITTTYLRGQSREYEVAYLNLYNKINQIYILMGIQVSPSLTAARNTVSLKVMITMIEDLLTQMDEHYYVAQSHHARLKKVLGWLYALREEGFGSYADSTMSGTDLLSSLNLEDYKDLISK